MLRRRGTTHARLRRAHVDAPNGDQGRGDCSTAERRSADGGSDPSQGSVSTLPAATLSVRYHDRPTSQRSLNRAVLRVQGAAGPVTLRPRARRFEPKERPHLLNGPWARSSIQGRRIEATPVVGFVTRLVPWDASRSAAEPRSGDPPGRRGPPGSVVGSFRTELRRALSGRLATRFSLSRSRSITTHGAVALNCS
jgi:hypothetical protein